jgi:hypothetical protein
LQSAFERKNHHPHRKKPARHFLLTSEGGDQCQADATKNGRDCQKKNQIHMIPEIVDIPRLIMNVQMSYIGKCSINSSIKRTSGALRASLSH